MQIRNYTIGSLDALRQFPNLDICQFTLNSRIFPAKRKVVDCLSKIEGVSNTKILVHYDFIYIISRFGMFKDFVQDAILSEIYKILTYAGTHSNILGIVMHTDFGLKKVCYQNPTDELIDKHYSKGLWDTDKIKRLASDLPNYTKNNIEDFFNKFSSKFGFTIGVIMKSP